MKQVLVRQKSMSSCVLHWRSFKFSFQSEKERFEILKSMVNLNPNGIFVMNEFTNVKKETLHAISRKIIDHARKSDKPNPRP